MIHNSILLYTCRDFTILTTWGFKDHCFCSIFRLDNVTYAFPCYDWSTKFYFEVSCSIPFQRCKSLVYISFDSFTSSSKSPDPTTYSRCFKHSHQWTDFDHATTTLGEYVHFSPFYWFLLHWLVYAYNKDIVWNKCEVGGQKRISKHKSNLEKLLEF